MGSDTKPKSVKLRHATRLYGISELQTTKPSEYYIASGTSLYYLHILSQNTKNQVLRK